MKTSTPAAATRTGRPVPLPDDLTQPFWDSARDHRLSIQRCSSCRRFNHAPSLTCPSCGSESLDFEDVSGHGKLYSYTLIQDPPGPGFHDLVPFVIAVVELVEQPRLLMVANLVDADPLHLRIGMDVEVTFEEIAEGCTLPQFRPTGE